MLTVHHLNNSRSQRILWLLEELGVEYHLETYQRDPKTGLAPAQMKAIHPLGRSPVLTTDTGSLAESGAIVEFIINSYGEGRFQPADDSLLRQQYWFWLHFAEGSLMPPRVAALVFSKAKDKMPWLLRPLASKILDGITEAYYGPNLKESMKYTESYLKNHEWFAGTEPTGADVQMIFPLETLVSMGRADAYPAVAKWVEKVHARPAYQRALEKGGRYDYA
ncbi:glutathione S-transferase family protein [Aestuariibacter sp. A3R04]|uniref:glutathione S-transferase family protein n=1 Tax=Aestuariibacter sp. A3R04 TaxID=2841571 RepID=UPI001C0A334F|nr:glutathione S-transferase [Aestuariibacter sp. A3R04]MBU3023683.1 glutathione S-transferase [Aestuariibacter sp. A3R04]